MVHARALYGCLADLLSYPRSSADIVQIAGEYERYTHPVPFDSLEPCFAEVTVHLRAFSEAVRGLSTGEMEELYTRTFDINPLSSLEMGWHLYGEQYERGTFLVRMRGLLREHGVEESTELPDHLTQALRLMQRMSDANADDLSKRYVIPSIEKMLTAFKDSDNPYQHILFAIQCLIQPDAVPEDIAHD